MGWFLEEELTEFLAGEYLSGLVCRVPFLFSAVIYVLLVIFDV